jgi:hypothetical protein
LFFRRYCSPLLGTITYAKALISLDFFLLHRTGLQSGLQSEAHHPSIDIAAHFVRTSNENVMSLLGDLSAFLPAIITAIASFLGAWIAAKLALGRFYREKIWERKVAAYTAIFEALHDIHRWYDTHLESEMTHRELKDDYISELSESYNKAKVNLHRRLDAEIWIIPDSCQDRLRKMFKVLDKRYDSWFEDLDGGAWELSMTIKDLRDLVQQDLGLGKSWPRRIATDIPRLLESWTIKPLKTLRKKPPVQ